MSAGTPIHVRDFGSAVVPGAPNTATSFDNRAFSDTSAPPYMAELRAATLKALADVDRETLAAHLAKAIMPGFVALNYLATEHAPPPEYFDGEMERPW